MTALTAALAFVLLGYVIGVLVERRRRERQVRAIRDARESSAGYLRETQHYLRGKRVR